jgi:hypothetical protein
MAKVKVRIPPNASLVYEGRVYRAGDELDIGKDEYAGQLLAAGQVVQVAARRRSRPTVRRGGKKADAGVRRAR